jgi:hypothetical protein
MLALGLVGGPTADAGIIVNISQVGADVVLTVGGSFTRPGSAIVDSFPLQTVFTGGNSGSSSSSFAFASSSSDYQEYPMSLVPPSPGGATSWGVGTEVVTIPSSVSLSGIDRMFAGFPSGKLYIASNYIDNTPINGTMTFAGKTLADLNITNFGTFSYDVPGSISTETFVVNITGGSGAAVPEPASLIMLSSVALVGGYRSFRRKSRRQVGGEVAQG